MNACLDGNKRFIYSPGDGKKGYDKKYVHRKARKRWNQRWD